MSFTEEVSQEYCIKVNKWVLIILAMVVGVFMIREIVFLTFFSDVKQMANHLSQQMDKTQQVISNKVNRDMETSDEWEKTLHNDANEFQEDVDQGLKQTQDYLDKVTAEHEARDKAFDKMFAEAPNKMREQHEAVTQKMHQAFLENSRRMQDEFYKETFKRQNVSNNNTHAKQQAN